MNLKYNESVLPNGVRVVTSEMPHIESTSIGIWAGVGGRYESRRSTGLSHFIEHLLFKGSKRRNAQEISQAIEGRGGYINAFTQEESTCYYARITADHTKDVMDILSDMYLYPSFDGQEIDKERGVIVEEIMMYRDQPHQHVQDMLAELLWDKHNLGRPLIGTPANINRVPRKEIVDFKRAKYVPGNTVVSMAGKLDHEACVAYAAKVFRRFKKQPLPKYALVTKQTPQRQVAILTKPIEQAHLALGIRLFGRENRKRFALKLLSVVLGENMSSRLFQSVRERHGLAYSIQSSVHLFQETGTLEIGAGLERARLQKAMALIVKEMVRLKERKVGAQELRRAKDYVIGQLRIGLESSVNQMMWIGENMMGYKAFTQPEEIVHKMEKVTAEDIQNLANQIFKPRYLSLALITPDEAASQEACMLEMIQKLGG